MLYLSINYFLFYLNQLYQEDHYSDINFMIKNMNKLGKNDQRKCVSIDYETLS